MRLPHIPLHLIKTFHLQLQLNSIMHKKTYEILKMTIILLADQPKEKEGKEMKGKHRFS